MPLNPGYPRQVSEDEWVIDNVALADTMALKIEEELKTVFRLVKGKEMPDSGSEELRILFVAVARGVLGYLDTHESELKAAIGDPPADHEHDVPLDVTWEGGTT